jgi:uncharacterized lipoprotein YbaY
MKRLLLSLAALNAGAYLYWHMTDAPAIAVIDHKSVLPPTIQLAAERPPPAAQCQTLGPIKSADVLEAVKGWLGDRFGAVQNRQDAEDGSVLYRVDISVPDEAAANRLLQRLPNAGGKDVAVLPKRAKEGGVLISFGLFAERSGAERRLQEVRTRGIGAGLELVHERWWLNFTSVDTPDAAELIKAVPAAEGVAVGPCPDQSPAEVVPDANEPATKVPQSPTTTQPSQSPSSKTPVTRPRLAMIG